MLQEWGLCRAWTGGSYWTHIPTCHHIIKQDGHGLGCPLNRRPCGFQGSVSGEQRLQVYSREVKGSVLPQGLLEVPSLKVM